MGVGSVILFEGIHSPDPGQILGGLFGPSRCGFADAMPLLSLRSNSI